MYREIYGGCLHIAVCIREIYGGLFAYCFLGLTTKGCSLKSGPKKAILYCLT